MNRSAIVISVLVLLGLAIANVLLGSNLITPLAVAEERGAGVPWYIVWSMVGLTAGCALVLGGFLLAATAKRK